MFGQDQVQNIARKILSDEPDAIVRFPPLCDVLRLDPIDLQLCAAGRQLPSQIG